MLLAVLKTRVMDTLALVCNVNEKQERKVTILEPT